MEFLEPFHAMLLPENEHPVILTDMALSIGNDYVCGDPEYSWDEYPRHDASLIRAVMNKLA
jgi:hypothetical protein